MKTTEQLVSLNTAKLLKEKGFANGSQGLYDLITNELAIQVTAFVNNERDEHLVEAPTQSLAQKWLRDTHQLHIVIQDSFNMETNEIKYYPVLYPFGKQYDNLSIDLRREKGEYVYLGKVWKYTYEEALETGLQQALTLI